MRKTYAESVQYLLKPARSKKTCAKPAHRVCADFTRFLLGFTRFSLWTLHKTDHSLKKKHFLKKVSVIKGSTGYRGLPCNNERGNSHGYEIGGSDEGEVQLVLLHLNDSLEVEKQCGECDRVLCP